MLILQMGISCELGPGLCKMPSMLAEMLAATGTQ